MALSPGIVANCMTLDANADHTSFVGSIRRLAILRMAIAEYRVSERGQMALPAEARRRWGIADGGAVEVADLGSALIIVPAGSGGLRSMVSAAIADAGGYASLAATVASEDPDLA